MFTNALVQGLLSSIGLPMLLMIAVGGLFGWRLLKDASKPMVAVGLLLLIGVAAWMYWPKKEFHHREPKPPHKPVAEAEAENRPDTYAEHPKPAIKKLEADRMAKINATEESRKAYLDPVRREKVIEAALTKEKARQEKAALLAKAEQERGFASVPPSPPAYAMTPDRARAQAFDMAEQRISQAQALLARVQQRHMPQPERLEFVWRNPYGSR
jgi:ABC-type nickel/cobalt efflux system permease component RcnA